MYLNQPGRHCAPSTMLCRSFKMAAVTAAASIRFDYVILHRATTQLNSQNVSTIAIQDFHRYPKKVAFNSLLSRTECAETWITVNVDFMGRIGCPRRFIRGTNIRVWCSRQLISMEASAIWQRYAHLAIAPGVRLMNASKEFVYCLIITLQLGCEQRRRRQDGAVVIVYL